MEKPKGFDNENDYDKYLAYLDSETWRKLRNECLRRDEFKCVICGSPNDLNAHHLIYPHFLGTESVHDLITVCKSCHVKIEKLKKSGEIIYKRWNSASIAITIRFETRYDYDAVDFSALCRSKKAKEWNVSVFAYFGKEKGLQYAKGYDTVYVGFSSLNKYKDFLAEFGEENVDWIILE